MNKKQLEKLSRFTARHDERNPRPIELICVANGKAVATDSFSLLELTTDTQDLHGLFAPKTGAEIQGTTATYPDYKTIIAEIERKPGTKIILNATYLFRMAQALKDCGRLGLNEVEIEFRSSHEPVVFRTTDPESKPVLGMIMPIRQ